MLSDRKDVLDEKGDEAMHPLTLGLLCFLRDAPHPKPAVPALLSSFAEVCGRTCREYTFFEDILS